MAYRVHSAVLAITAALFLMATPAYAHFIPKPCDFSTGGGFVINDSNDHANFGFNAGWKHHEFHGHVNFIDVHADLTQA